MRNMTWMTAAVLAFGLMAYTPTDAKAQVYLGVGSTYGYNTPYVPAYAYPAYGGYYGSGVTVATPGFAFSYGRPYGYYGGGYGGYYGGYRSAYYGGYRGGYGGGRYYGGRRWR